MKQNRYDTLRDRIRRQFSRTKTYEVDLEPGEAFTLLKVDDPDFVANDNFQEHGPFNNVAIVGESGEVTAYTRTNRETYVVVDGGGSGPPTPAVPTTERTGQRYIGYLRLEADDDEGFAGRIHVGLEVDSQELRLMEMSGLLDVSQ